MEFDARQPLLRTLELGGSDLDAHQPTEPLVQHRRQQAVPAREIERTVATTMAQGLLGLVEAEHSIVFAERLRARPGDLLLLLHLRSGFGVHVGFHRSVGNREACRRSSPPSPTASSSSSNAHAAEERGPAFEPATATLRRVLANIVGFHQDEEGAWVAELSCGHRQHVRHNPPWQQREWVTTEDGRRGKLGVELDCRYCDMAKVPDGAAPYRRTDTFTEET